MKQIVLWIIKYCSWPIVLLVCFCSMHSQLVHLLNRMRSLHAGSVELVLTDQLQSQGLSDAQLKAISQLSADDLDLFMVASFSDHPFFHYTAPLPASEFKQRMARLQDAGLLYITTPDDVGTNLLHQTTPTGKRFRAMLINSTASLLHQATD